MIDFIFPKGYNIHEPTIREIINVYEPYTKQDCKIVVKVITDCGNFSLVVQLGDIVETSSVEKELIAKKVKAMVYKVLSRHCAFKLAWGSLTGVKPLMLLENTSPTNINSHIEKLQKQYMISDDRCSLMRQTYEIQQQHILEDRSKCSLYVHIPLCLTKCVYCSFPSKITDIGSNLCESYLLALLKELKATLLHIRGKGLSIQTIYIGGGTPSILSTKQIERLLSAIREEISSLVEFSFEAGRCDTLDREKLLCLKDNGVTRLSLNPQTFHSATLAKLNRTVGTDEFYKIYSYAKETGFNSINCDLIYGFEDESIEDNIYSLEKTIALNPENITIHTLCKKRTSALNKESVYSQSSNINKAHKLSRETLASNGYDPYYLYKQQYAILGCENIGYSKKDCECIYNIKMMSNAQEIYSVGASSTTKVFDSETGRYKNIYTLKEVGLYISEIDRIIQKKLSKM